MVGCDSGTGSPGVMYESDVDVAECLLVAFTWCWWDILIQNGDRLGLWVLGFMRVMVGNLELR